MPDLATLVDAWSRSADSLLELTADLSDDLWSRPTDCPGWDVADVVAHLLHLETELADGSTPAPGDGDGTVVAAEYTEAGVAALRGRDPHDLHAAFAAVVDRRRAQLDPAPTSPHGRPPHTPGGVDWDWQTFLQNRVIDLWVHEQDVRRAVGAPGGLDSPGAQATLEVFAGALGYVVGRRVRPPTGTVVAVDVHGPVAFSSRLRIEPGGRARPVDETVPADAIVATDTETFAVLCAGRRSPADVEVALSGDVDLATRVCASMAVTP
ncbi:maleylpyruvate isomerase family mycothiol-dependent enzyme [Solicola sp. PLA-1-18]|uniref:maleylpyruvate isomerase family mycothiol-dependent enzyme n=1 Tax=Solicola sp. PLA-1-18 TaxID=3380532 RepID=UPI003B775D8D